MSLLMFFFLSVTGVNKFLYDLLSFNGIVHSWKTDKLDSLVKMLTLSQNIGVAVVVVIPGGGWG